jgi:hypothetical protein
MNIDELKSRIDLNDLAERLGWKRQGAEKPNGNALYHSPLRKDAQASVSVYEGARKWKDHTTGDGGSCIDMVIYSDGLAADDSAGAIRRLHEIYGWPLERPKQAGGDGQSAGPAREKSLAEYIADRCLMAPERAIEYLVSERGIGEEVVKRAVLKKSVGFNDYTSAKVEAGQPGYGGPACAFIVRTLNPGHVVAVDLRYLDKDLNGGVKTQCQGEKHGYGWTSDIKRLMGAETVYIVESPINALSVESAIAHHRTAAFAIRGVSNLDIDYSFLRGRQVVLCLDNDAPIADGPQAGFRPGLRAAWALHEKLTALDISALMVDQEQWEGVNDVNDLLKAEGADGLRRLLARWEQWLIPGMPGKFEEGFGRRRIYLPYHHDLKYWRYRVRPDFTSYVSKVEQDGAGDGESVEPKLEFKELCGFRIAAISRVAIQGATATMTGDDDSQGKTLFAVSVQTTRHGATLIRKVVEDEKLHNIDTWKRFGAVWDQSNFLRMVNLLENAAHIGARDAANFVGLCFKGGRPVVNEGPDCYFTNPDQQCPYHNLTFPSGSRQDARTVIAEYQQTFGGNAALLVLIWALGGHLKILLGFWPHLQLQADKGAGKSTLIKRLERTIAFTMFSGQSLQTEFRLLTSISHTAHPVGWEELSARRQDIIDKAVGLLQESYQYTLTRRGADMTEFLLSAPVMLAGEDVPVRSLIGKLVRAELKVKGDLMSDDLPRFPVRQWLEFLTGFTPAQVRAMYVAFRQKCLEASRASGDDDGATRMAGNYAALLTAWRLLSEFAEIDTAQGGLLADLKAQMNAHIAETSADRAPWVWILETFLAELAGGKFALPFRFDTAAGEPCLLVRTSDVMHHLATENRLRDIWNGLPVKSDRVFKKQLVHAGVTVGEGHERTINGRRVAHMTALSLYRLKDYGLHAAEVVPQEPNREPPPL